MRCRKGFQNVNFCISNGLFILERCSIITAKVRAKKKCHNPLTRVIQFVCRHSRSYETISFEKEQSILLWMNYQCFFKAMMSPGGETPNYDVHEQKRPLYSISNKRLMRWIFCKDLLFQAVLWFPSTEGAKMKVVEGFFLPERYRVFQLRRQKL